ncbi:hypothetical protein [Nitrosococcus halophilus]|nr:hypothetical protein [Nitrosococcus halophilus]
MTKMNLFKKSIKNMEDTMKAKIITIALLLTGSVFLNGCEQEGPAESAGEKVDETMEEAGEKMEEAGERAQEATE